MSLFSSSRFNFNSVSFSSLGAWLNLSLSFFFSFYSQPSLCARIFAFPSPPLHTHSLLSLPLWLTQWLFSFMPSSTHKHAYAHTLALFPLEAICLNRWSFRFKTGAAREVERGGGEGRKTENYRSMRWGRQGGKDWKWLQRDVMWWDIEGHYVPCDVLYRASGVEIIKVVGVITLTATVMHVLYSLPSSLMSKLLLN